MPIKIIFLFFLQFNGLNQGFLFTRCINLLFDILDNKIYLQLPSRLFLLNFVRLYHTTFIPNWLLFSRSIFKGFKMYIRFNFQLYTKY